MPYTRPRSLSGIIFPSPCSLVERLGCRLLVFFVRHAALLRPLGEQGKLQVRVVKPFR
jgi:hypothetical protein